MPQDFPCYERTAMWLILLTLTVVKNLLMKQNTDISISMTLQASHGVLTRDKLEEMGWETFNIYLMQVSVYIS